jgi:hypothetical protein
MTRLVSIASTTGTGSRILNDHKIIVNYSLADSVLYLLVTVTIRPLLVPLETPPM